MVVDRCAGLAFSQRYQSRILRIVATWQFWLCSLEMLKATSPAYARSEPCWELLVPPPSAANGTTATCR